MFSSKLFRNFLLLFSLFTIANIPVEAAAKPRATKARTPKARVKALPKKATVTKGAKAKPQAKPKGLPKKTKAKVLPKKAKGKVIPKKTKAKVLPKKPKAVLPKKASVAKALPSKSVNQQVAAVNKKIQVQKAQRLSEQKTEVRLQQQRHNKSERELAQVRKENTRQLQETKIRVEEEVKRDLENKKKQEKKEENIKAQKATHDAFLSAPLEYRQMARKIKDARNPSFVNNMNNPYNAASVGAEDTAPTELYTYLPAVPVFHPAQLIQPFASKDYDRPTFSVIVKNIPGYNLEILPEELQTQLQGRDVQKVKVACVFQNAPWYTDIRPGAEDNNLRALEPWLQGKSVRPIQFKPHGGLTPDGEKNVTVNVGIFSKHPNGPRLEDQPEGGLIRNYQAHIKRAPQPQGHLYSNNNDLNLAIDLNQSHDFYSYIENGDETLITRHVMLGKEDQQRLEILISPDRNQTLRDIYDDLKVEKGRGHFQNIDVDDLERL